MLEHYRQSGHNAEKSVVNVIVVVDAAVGANAGRAITIVIARRTEPPRTIA